MTILKTAARETSLKPTQSIEFQGFLINSVTLEIILPLNEVKNIRNECIITDLTRLIGKLSTVIPASLLSPHTA